MLVTACTVNRNLQPCRAGSQDSVRRSVSSGGLAMARGTSRPLRKDIVATNGGRSQVQDTRSPSETGRQSTHCAQLVCHEESEGAKTAERHTSLSEHVWSGGIAAVVFERSSYLDRGLSKFALTRPVELSCTVLDERRGDESSVPTSAPSPMAGGVRSAPISTGARDIDAVRTRTSTSSPGATS